MILARIEDNSDCDAGTTAVSSASRTPSSEFCRGVEAHLEMYLRAMASDAPDCSVGNAKHRL